mgnify:CR=1 FL=1|tara:strand:+ start:5437 stop:5907 length:471 start_codon:yes stop_codon:yes gene_type:complete
MKNFVLIFFLFLTIGILDGQYNHRSTQIGSSLDLTGEDFINGEDGVPRMSINVWGHVKYPGTYLVYDGIDLLTCLSMSGGPMQGAKLSDVTIISKDGELKSVNLNKLVKNNQIDSIKLYPYDTIKIDEKFSNVLLTRTSIIAVLLQLTNVFINASK